MAESAKRLLDGGVSSARRPLHALGQRVQRRNEDGRSIPISSANRRSGADPTGLLETWFKRANGIGIVDAMLLTDQMTYLPNDLLVKVDIATMAVSLEARSPFLDHHVIEFAASLPQNLKLRGLTRKYLLKKVLRSCCRVRI